jgi:hypothetical protein
VVPEAPVRWDAPPGCPDVQVVSDRISDLLGRPVQSGEIALHGTITAVAAGWSLQLQTTVGELEDTRTLDANDCSVLADAAALVAVVMLDPVLAAATIESRAAAAAAVTEEVKPKSPKAAPKIPEVEEEPQPPPPTTRPPRRWDRPPPRARKPGEPPGMWLRLRGGGEFGAVPGGTGGFEIAYAIGSDRVRGEIAGAYWIGRPTTDGSARIHLGTATPRVCGLIAAGPIDVPLCAGVELGGMLAQSTGATQSRTRLWFAVQAEPGIRWAFSKRVSLWVAAQAFVPIVYPRFVLADPDDPTRDEREVHRPSPAGLRGLVGFEFRLLGTERGR